MENSFISNVNILAGMRNILTELNSNIQTFKNIESNELGIGKVVELETGIISIRDNMSKLILVANANNELLGIANKLDDLLQVNTNTDNFFLNYSEAKTLVSKFRVEIDEIFTLNPQIKSIYQEINLKNQNINKNILIAQQSSLSASASAGVAVAAKNAIEEKYQVYETATSIEDEVVIVAGIKNEIIALKNDLLKIIAVFNKLGNIDTVVSFKNSIENLALNIQEIKDAITITTQNKNTTSQNVSITTQDKNLVKQYKDEVVENRNVSLTLRDATIKASNDAKEIANQINRQSTSNSKLAFTVHSVATRLSIEFSNLIIAVKKMQEEKEIELDLFAENLTQNLNLEIANAKSIVAKDVVTSQKIVSEISANLSLLTEAKHRENKNEIRFKNSELVSLLAVSKMMLENKIISDNTANQILEFENKLKGYEHEKIKNLLNSLTADKRVELLVAKGLLTDIKLQTL